MNARDPRSASSFTTRRERAVGLHRMRSIRRRRERPSALQVLLPALLIAVPALAAPPTELLRPRLYRVTIETGMPHLEENLRYATTRREICIGQRELASAFPILRHDALAGCRLDDAGGAERRDPAADDAAIAFVLRCEGGDGTTGAAQWRLAADQIRGTLDVKLGGKNMTFYQRITGIALADCDSTADR
jgi:hypothetical protein